MDSDLEVDKDERKITSGYVFLLESIVISRSSKKQETVALSSFEAEFVTVARVTIDCLVQEDSKRFRYS